MMLAGAGISEPPRNVCASARNMNARHASINHQPKMESIMKPIKAVRSVLLSMLLAAGAAAAPAFAQISFNIVIAPPALQYEAVPVIAPGYVWAPGYWAWSGDRHIWVRGRTIVHRVGYRWEPDRWEQRDHAYYRHPGRWDRDPGYKLVKVKKAKKPKHWDNDGDNGKRGHGNSGNHGKGGKHDR